ncbi:hypothetical protein QLQ78_gp49 [Gordonia phage Jojo24]|uniref:Uncharacterized protein n=1 Tax=Gordonia phage Jojo24 TaxID=2859476 RepID=A0AAE7VFU5_9CAUD|nr:hypothetical protein QLQ78_gp49 [Gordonia phage Jojo24]QXO13146.1 hypothetical protein SEA_JOJO24_49 [Gordonia phage Jojo24]
MSDDIRARAREAVGAWDHFDQGSKRFVPGVKVLVEIIRGLLAELELDQAAKVPDDEYPETLAVAKLIYEHLPSEDPGGGVEPWDELTDEQRAAFIMNARNLGQVFPDEYPKLAAEVARYRYAQDRDKS